MKYLKVFLVLYSLLFSVWAFGWVTLNMLSMQLDDSEYSWPCLTHCRGCGERIWVWQDHYRQSYPVDLHNGSNVPMQVHFEGEMHHDCYWNTSPFKVIVYSNPHSELQMLIGNGREIIYPYESLDIEFAVPQSIKPLPASPVITNASFVHGN